jgi:hypothetical protein
MTLSFVASVRTINNGIANISIEANNMFDAEINGSYSGMYSVTIPANTDLSTLTVTASTRVFVTNPSEVANITLGTITVQ